MRLLKTAFCFSYPAFSKLELKAQTSFSAQNLTIEKVKELKKLPDLFDPNQIKFGSTSTDHMLIIDFINGKWEAPKIIPFQNFQINPFNSTLHYGIECFQGFKAYKNKNNQIRLFRPQCNIYRFKNSARNLALPEFDGEQLLKCIIELIKIESRWIPAKRGFSLYVRPTFISLQNSLGVKAAQSSRIFCVVSSTGPYYPQGFKPISLFADQKKIRAAPGGMGQYKVGGNYAGTLKTSNDAIKKGFNQVLWTYNNIVCQVGSSNIFFVIKKQGKKRLITPKLNGMILPGVTRDSILNLMKNNSQYQLNQQEILLSDVQRMLQSKQIVEVFGAGTAVIVSPVSCLGISKGSEIKRYNLSIQQKLHSGPVAHQIFQKMLDIQQGIVQHPYSKKIQ